MLLMSSSMFTVLPTPAPPKRPILPPFANGQMRSITLMPVSSSSTEGESSSNLGAVRWIERRSSLLMGPASSIGRPSTSMMRPSVPLPTGTEIGAPVPFTFMPRRRPSEDPSAMQRTTPSPSCCSTSKVRPFSARLFSPESSSTSASYTPGIASRGNSMSITAPMHWTMVPDVWASAMRFPSGAFQNGFPLPSPPHLEEGCPRSGRGGGGDLSFASSYRRRAADDLGDLFGDPRLPVLVVDERQLVDQGLGVVGGGLHRDHARALLGGHVLGDRLEDDRLDVAREHLLEHGLRLGLVDIVPVARGGAEPLAREGQQLLHDGLLLHGVDEARVEEQVAVEAVLRVAVEHHLHRADQLVHL